MSFNILLTRKMSQSVTRRSRNRRAEPFSGSAIIVETLKRFQPTLIYIIVHGRRPRLPIVETAGVSTYSPYLKYNAKRQITQCVSYPHLFVIPAEAGIQPIYNFCSNS